MAKKKKKKKNSAYKVMLSGKKKKACVHPVHLSWNKKSFLPTPELHPV